MTLPFLIDADILERLARRSGGGCRSGPSAHREERSLHFRALQTILLRQTLEAAYRDVPFHRGRMEASGFRPGDFGAPADLAALPPLHRSEVEAELPATIARGSRIATLRSTSGTARGHSLPIYVGQEELAAAAALERVASGGGGYESGPDIMLHVKPCVQRIMGPGVPRGFDLVAMLNIDAPAPFRMDVGYEDFIIQQLFETFPIPGKNGRITILRFVPPFMLTHLTAVMRRHGVDPRSTAVRRLLVAGGTVTARLCRIARDDWNARLESSYSCAEIGGYAWQTGDHPRVYTWGPDVYVEVLDARTLEPVSPGEDGLLVLTSLHPFQQMQPFIRYAVGDAVTWLGSFEEGFDGPTVRFRGRAAASPGLEAVLGPPGARRVVGSADVESALSLFPEIPAEFFPRFRVSVSEAGLTLDVETVVVSGPDWAESLRGRIAAALREEVGGMDALPVRVVLHNKGMLKDFARLYPSR